MTKQRLMLIGASLVAMTFSSVAAAQGPQSVPIRVTFTGNVTTSAQSTVMVRQPDGSMGPYTGVTPAYNYQVNDPVSISFNTEMPTQAFFAANPQYQNADGVYRYPVNMQDATLPFGKVAKGALDISGPITLTSAQQPTNMGGITLVYDSNSGQYSMEMPTGQWAFAAVDGPSYNYNFATNTLTPSNSTCPSGNCSQGTGMAAKGTETTVSYRGTIIDASTPQPTTAGFWDMVWAGSWNLPTYGSGTSGNPTQVPEPSVLVLFGSAAAGLMFVRRRKRKMA